MQRGRSMSSSSYSSSSYSSSPDDLVHNTTTTTTTTTGVVAPTNTTTLVSQPGIAVVGTQALARDVANIHLGPEEPLKGRGSKLRNKLHRSKKNKHATPAVIATTGVVGTGLGTGLVAGELVDRSKFNGHGPVDQLDQKLADRNLVDNAASGMRGELYNVGGFPAVESYRQDPQNIMRHKFTGQTHFDHEGPSTGPGFTNGDLYDKPGFAGTKGGQPLHNGPITALAHKIVGQKYTTHEPLMDKIYVEPHQKGPIDALAHMIVGKGGEHPTQSYGGFHDDVVKQGFMTKVKDALHLKSNLTGETIVNKEKAEGPVDALVHKLTGTLHDPIHHKGGLGAQHDGVLGGATTIPVTDNVAHTVVTDGAVGHSHVGFFGKIANKLHHHHDSTVIDKAL